MSKKQVEIPSFDEIRAMLAESAREFDRRLAESVRRGEEFDRRLAESAREFDRRLAESVRRGEEFDRRLAESAREFDRHQAESVRRDEEERIRRREEFNREQAESAKRLKKIEALVGGISENIGHHAEQFFQDALDASLTFGGEKYDKMYPNMTRSGEKGVELDIVLVNGKSVAIIEAKNRIHPNNVTELAEKKLAKFREFFIEYKNHKVYLGIAGFSFSRAVLERAQKYGMGIIRQVGEAIEVEADYLKAY